MNPFSFFASVLMTVGGIMTAANLQAASGQDSKDASFQSPAAQSSLPNQNSSESNAVNPQHFLSIPFGPPKFQPMNAGGSNPVNPGQVFFKSVQGIKSESEVTDYKEGGVSPGPVPIPYPNKAAIQNAFGKPIIPSDEGIFLAKPNHAGGVEASFNPKEIAIDKQVPWQKHKNTEGDAPTLEFKAAEPKTMNVELMEDMFESKSGQVSRLPNPHLKLEEPTKRPPKISVPEFNTPQFKGVVEDMNTKYTMFMPDGTPTRATVNLQMKQAQKAANKQEESSSQNKREADKN